MSYDDFASIKKGQITSADWLETFLKGGPRTVAQVKEAAKVAGFSWASIANARTLLGNVRSPSYGVWKLD